MCVNDLSDNCVCCFKLPICHLKLLWNSSESTEESVSPWRRWRVQDSQPGLRSLPAIQPLSPRYAWAPVQKCLFGVNNQSRTEYMLCALNVVALLRTACEASCFCVLGKYLPVSELVVLTSTSSCSLWNPRYLVYRVFSVFCCDVFYLLPVWLFWMFRLIFIFIIVFPR